MKRLQLIALVSVLMPRISALAVDPVYFILSAPPGYPVNDALIVPMTDPGNIAHTRALIQEGYDSKDPYTHFIPVINAAAGRDGLNRNYSMASMPEWSWHASYFGFAEVVGGDADTIPTGLEQDYDWANNPPTGVTAAFTNYRFTRELGSLPLFLDLQRTGNSIDVYWNTPQTSWVYTLQQNWGFASNAWTSVPGFSWPVTTNHVTSALTNAASLNFRVVAN